MSDKFSLYQTDGLWGIIENASNEKQTSIKSYFGSDLIIKRLNEQADQIDQLKQQLAETEQKFLEFQEDSIRNEQTYVRELTEKDKEIEKLKQQYTILENENGKLTTELIMDKYKKAQKEVSFGKQLAIQELEKVKIELKNKICLMQNTEHCYSQRFISWYEMCNQINKQIKELKGNKNEEV